MRLTTGKSLTASIAAIALALGTSCGQRDLLSEDIKLRTSEPSSWIVPAATGDISIEQLLRSNEVGDELFVRNDSLFFRWEHKGLFGFSSLESFFPSPINEITANGRIPESGYTATITLPIVNAEALEPYFPEVQKTLSLKLPQEVRSVREAQLSLDLTIDLSNIPVSGKASVSFPALKAEDGSVISATFDIDKNKSTNQYTLPIKANYTTATTGNTITLPYTIKFKPTENSGTINLTAGDAMTYNMKLSGIKVLSFAGKTDQYTADIYNGNTAWKFSFWNNIERAKLRNGRMLLNVYAKDMSCSMIFKPQVEVLHENNPSSTWQGPARQVEIGGNTQISYATEELEGLLSAVKADGLRVGGQVTINGTENEVVLKSSSSVTVDAYLEQPLNFGFDKLEVTLPFANLDLSSIAETESVFDSIDLTLRSVSTVPLEIHCEYLELLDSDKKPLPGDNKIAFTGKLSGNEDSTPEVINLRLTADQIKLLRDAKGVNLVANISTTEKKIVQLRASQRIRLQLIAGVKYQLK